MKVAGAYTVPVPRERAYALLHDPAVLAKCIPGCESLDNIGEDEYAMRMKMLLGSMSGQFEGKVKIGDPHPPSSFRLTVSGTGKIGFMKGEGVLTLADVAGQSGDQQTSVQCEGDVQVGGTIALVGQRMIDTTAKMMIKRFFEALSKAAATTAVTH